MIQLHLGQQHLNSKHVAHFLLSCYKNDNPILRRSRAAKSFVELVFGPDITYDIIESGGYCFVWSDFLCDIPHMMSMWQVGSRTKTQTYPHRGTAKHPPTHTHIFYILHRNILARAHTHGMLMSVLQAAGLLSLSPEPASLSHLSLVPIDTKTQPRATWA